VHTSRACPDFSLCSKTEGTGTLRSASQSYPSADAVRQLGQSEMGLILICIWILVMTNGISLENVDSLFTAELDQLLLKCISITKYKLHFF